MSIKHLEPIPPGDFEREHPALMDALHAPLDQVIYCWCCDGLRVIGHVCACWHCGQPEATCTCGAKEMAAAFRKILAAP